METRTVLESPGLFRRLHHFDPSECDERHSRRRAGFAPVANDTRDDSSGYEGVSHYVVVGFPTEEWHECNVDRFEGEAVAMRAHKYLVIIAACLAFAIGCNPFAPKLDESTPSAQFGDPHRIDSNGYFQAFKYAYEFKDTTLYGTLLAPNFTFSYRNYDRGVDITWGRDDEMRSTSGLFNAAESLTLLWGNVLAESGNKTSYDITLSFSLDVTFNPGDIEHVDGRAVFHLERPTAGDPWKAVSWLDQSNL